MLVRQIAIIALPGDFIFVTFFFFALFLGPHPRHMEVPRLGVESELQLSAYTTATATRDPSCVFDLHHSSWQRRSLTHCARPGIEPASSWILVRFVSVAPQQNSFLFYFIYFFVISNDLWLRFHNVGSISCHLFTACIWQTFLKCIRP